MSILPLQHKPAIRPSHYADRPLLLRGKEWQQYADPNYLQAAIRHSTDRFLIPFENYTGISLIDYTKFRNDLIKIQKMH